MVKDKRDHAKKLHTSVTGADFYGNPAVFSAVAGVRPEALRPWLSLKCAKARIIRVFPSLVNACESSTNRAPLQAVPCSTTPCAALITTGTSWKKADNPLSTDLLTHHRSGVGALTRRSVAQTALFFEAIDPMIKRANGHFHTQTAAPPPPPPPARQYIVRG